MKKNTSRIVGLCSAGAAMLALQTAVSAQTLFSDNFQTDTSPSWTIFASSANGATNDFSAQFAFDYSLQTYSFNGATLTVPPAPNSGGTTKGLKVTVNKNGNNSNAGLSLYPNGQTFSNNYALKFDLWMDYNGDVAFGGTGSTEFSTYGINHVGTQVNWSGSTGSDGIWFANDAEAGTDRDYRAYIGTGDGAPNFELTDTTGGFFDRDGDGLADQNGPDDSTFSGFQLMFKAPPFQTPGGIGKRWVQVEVRQRDGVVTWLIDGYIIATRSDNLGGYVSGNIMLGYMDPITGIADPANENYAIFDNVRVVDLTTNVPLPVVDIIATDPNATETGGDTGTFTLTRTGDLASPLTVSLIVAGTASNGVDYVTIPNAVTFAAGIDTTNITVTPVNDSLGESTETVILGVVANLGVYEVGKNAAVVNLADDGDVPVATIKATRPVAYENYRTGGLTVNFSNPNFDDTLVQYSISGTATNGIDYVSLTNKVLVAAGQTNATIFIQPINNTNIDGNRTIVLTLSSGSGYTVGGTSNNSATVTIRDDDLPAGNLVFSDDFDSPTSGGNWVVNKSQAVSAATFNYDYSADGIPPAPNSVGGTTKGLKFESLATVRVGISASPIGKSFSGDYRLRFDMWINYNGSPLSVGGSQSTECFDAGLGTTGNHPNWDATGADGVWFAVTGDNGYGDDYEAWTGTTELGASSGAYSAGSQNGNVAYYAEFGGDPAPQFQQDNYPGIQVGTTGAGNGGFAWHDVVITKQGTNVTWKIDGLLISTVNISSLTLSSNVFVGYMDDSTGASPFPTLSFGVADNVRVETLSLPRPTITSIKIVGGNVQIDFAGTASDTIASFKVQSSATVNGTLADLSPAATISSLGGGAFRATTPVNGSVRFYRVSR